MGPMVVMGVSGCGKSTLARALAGMLGWFFLEGDDCHSPRNIAKMTAGIPLSDEDRWPFLDSVGRTLNHHAETGIVASCSALRLVYRDRIRARCPNVRFILPVLTPDELRSRLTTRKGHFMHVALLDSQLFTFEQPEDREEVVAIDGVLPLYDQVSSVLKQLSGVSERDAAPISVTAAIDEHQQRRSRPDC